MRRVALVMAGLALASVASSQVKWNEMPLPDGVFREYKGDYRTDVIDIALDGGESLSTSWESTRATRSSISGMRWP